MTNTWLVFLFIFFLLFLIYLGILMTKYTDMVAELTAQIRENGDVVDSAMLLIRDIHGKLQAAIDNQDFSALKDLNKMLKDKDAELSAAIVANTDADPNAASPAYQDPTNNQGPVLSGTATTGTSSAPDTGDVSGDVSGAVGVASTADKTPNDPAGTSTK